MDGFGGRRMDVREFSTTRRNLRRNMDGSLCTPPPPPLPPHMTTPEAYLNSAPSFPRLKSIKIYTREDGSFWPDDPQFKKGTTVLAFIVEEGIIVAADFSSKSSTKNIVKLNSHMLATISGGSEFLLHDLQEKCYLQEQMEGRKTSVADALKWLSDTLSAHKEELSIGILIAVWNESERGLYHMNGKGEVVEDDVLTTGSGSFAIALLKNELRLYGDFRTSYDQRRLRKRNMPINIAADLATRAICNAAYRAPHSGDTYSVYHLGSGGCNKLFEDDMEEWQKANMKTRGWKYEVIGKGWTEP